MPGTAPAGHRIVLIGLLTVLSLLTAAPAAPAVDRRAQPQLSLSTDGVTFTTGPLDPILVGITHFTPGDSDRQRLWVRNDSSQTAWLWSTYQIDEMDPALRPYARIAAAYAPRDASILSAAQAPGRSCQTLLPSRTVPPGEAVALDLATGILPAAPNSTRQTRGHYLVRVGLAEDVGQQRVDGCIAVGDDPGTSPRGHGDGPGEGGPPRDDESADPQRGGVLPFTGWSPLPWLAAGVGALLLGGAIIATTRRRRRTRQDRTATANGQEGANQ